jgi:Rieske Fe-S protein
MTTPSDRRRPDLATPAEPVPIWRRDFPYTSEGEETVTRREFGRYLVLASGLFAAGNVGIAAWASARTSTDAPPAPIIADADLPEGGVHLFRYPTAKDPAILLRLPDGELRAFSQKCTHLGCVVYYEQEHRQLVCPCHEGFFDDADGSVIHGPPTRDLPVIPVEVGDDGMIWALGGGGH